MQSQTLSPALSRALYDIIHYETTQFRNENIRSVLRYFIEREAEQGFATYLFEVLPQVNNVFDFIRAAEQELKETNAAITAPAAANTRAVIDWIISLAEPVCIYRLNKKSTPEHNIMDLIIVMSKHASKKFKDYSTIINSVSMRGRPINYSLYKMGIVN